MAVTGLPVYFSFVDMNNRSIFELRRNNFLLLHGLKELSELLD